MGQETIEKSTNEYAAKANDLNSCAANVGNSYESVPSTISEQAGPSWLYKSDTCKRCGIEADGNKSLICDRCEAMYHISCTESVIQESPVRSWYCDQCTGKIECEEIDVSNNQHDCLHEGCVVCQRLKASEFEEDKHMVTETIEKSTNEYAAKANVLNSCAATVVNSCAANVGNSYESVPSTISEQAGPSWLYKSATCKRCGIEADGNKSLICDRCEAMYHISCTEPVIQESPVRSWYCDQCTGKIECEEIDVSNNQHDCLHEGCVVCQRLIASEFEEDKHMVTENSATVNIDRQRDCSLPCEENGNADNESPELSRTAVLHLCKFCGTREDDGKFLTCSHRDCHFKYYHIRCLNAAQMARNHQPAGLWYCPSCLCRACLTDKDDHLVCLCDRCDEAYHTYCMNPPKKAIPKGTWCCTSCNKARIKEAVKRYEQNILAMQVARSEVAKKSKRHSSKNDVKIESEEYGESSEAVPRGDGKLNDLQLTKEVDTEQLRKQIHQNSPSYQAKTFQHRQLERTDLDLQHLHLRMNQSKKNIVSGQNRNGDTNGRCEQKRLRRNDDMNKLNNPEHLCKFCGMREDDDGKFLTCSHRDCHFKYYHIRCLSAAQMARNHQPAGLWYCPSCLCRACLTDKDDHLVCLCDRCDEAYHTYCMNPPKKAIPKGIWCCTSCNKARIKEAVKRYEQNILAMQVARSEVAKQSKRHGSKNDVKMECVEYGESSEADPRRDGKLNDLQLTKEVDTGQLRKQIHQNSPSYQAKTFQHRQLERTDLDLQHVHLRINQSKKNIVSGQNSNGDTNRLRRKDDMNKLNNPKRLRGNNSINTINKRNQSNLKQRHGRNDVHGQHTNGYMEEQPAEQQMDKKLTRQRRHSLQFSLPLPKSINGQHLNGNLDEQRLGDGSKIEKTVDNHVQHSMGQIDVLLEALDASEKMAWCICEMVDEADPDRCN